MTDDDLEVIRGGGRLCDDDLEAFGGRRRFDALDQPRPRDTATSEPDPPPYGGLKTFTEPASTASYRGQIQCLQIIEWKLTG